MINMITEFAKETKAVVDARKKFESTKLVMEVSLFGAILSMATTLIAPVVVEPIAVVLVVGFAVTVVLLTVADTFATKHAVATNELLVADRELVAAMIESEEKTNKAAFASGDGSVEVKTKVVKDKKVAKPKKKK